MPHGGARDGAGRPKGKRDTTLRDAVEDIRRNLPAVIPPKPISVEEADAAGHIDNIMQHAARMAASYAPAAPGQPANKNESVELYLKWTEIVLVTAGKLIPYQRPTYRSVEVRDERANEQRLRNSVEQMTTFVPHHLWEIKVCHPNGVWKWPA
jgi:predicted metal-dependent phosphoesterase TrpH